MKNGMRDEANLSRQHAFVRKAILAHFYIQTTSPFCSTAKTHIAGETILYAKLHVEQTRPYFQSKANDAKEGKMQGAFSFIKLIK